jgi:hypothetical protein
MIRLRRGPQPLTPAALPQPSFALRASEGKEGRTLREMAIGHFVRGSK